MHVEWGGSGLRENGRVVDTVVVVDVLSFSTTVSVALDRGATVYPLGSGDRYAPAVATRLGAQLAGNRGDRLSLSPPSMQVLGEGDRVVLPSPNGAALALAAASRGLNVVAGCFRNASAVAAYLTDRQRRWMILAAGERWHDGSIRFALEDLLGAGCILNQVDAATLTAEARAAAAAFVVARPHLESTLRDCTSGQELVAGGYAQDPQWAAVVDASDRVPVLTDGCFRTA